MNDQLLQKIKELQGPFLGVYLESRGELFDDLVSQLTASEEELKAYKSLLDYSLSTILNANDFFYWACGDAVAIDRALYPKVIELIKKYGEQAAVNAVMVWLRKTPPQEPVLERIDCDAYRSALAELEGYVPFEGWEYEEFGVDKQKIEMIKELQETREVLDWFLNQQMNRSYVAGQKTVQELQAKYPK